jgi:hypothetical protein
MILPSLLPNYSVRKVPSNLKEKAHLNSKGEGGKEAFEFSEFPVVGSVHII